MRKLGILLMAALLVFPAAHASLVSAQSRNSFVCPMHTDVVSSKPGDCPRCGMELVARAVKSRARSKVRRKRITRGTRHASGARLKAQPKPTEPAPPRPFSELSTAERVRALEQLAPTYEYSCVMHPEVRQAQDGTCPKCGMMLMSIKPSVLGEYKLALATKPLRPKAGEKARLRFVISNPQTGARVRDYVVNHEKLFHLFIVSQDMTEYQHIHPRLERDGSFEVETVFPQAGLYKIHADFFPAGGTPQVLHRELSTA
ncbi:MAG TPA: heavy metal-binding domain-containing protein, partial [Pyrinomonadaceae bacterium]